MRKARMVPCVIGISALAALVLTPQAQATYPAPDGLIVFAADTGSGSQLYTVQPNGRDLRQITAVEGDAVSPDWSPDGRTIVFELDHPSGPPYCSIELMNADGTGMVDLTGDRAGCDTQPSFTPDGTRIVFERYNDVKNVDAIWRMDLNGSHRHLITTGTGGGGTDPNVSPDGSTISFIEGDGDLRQAVYTVHMDGTALTQIVPFRFDVAIKHDWSTNGGRIVFTDNADNFAKSANIATIRADGTGLQYLTHYRNPQLRAYVGSYSPDGRWIVFRLEDHGTYSLYRMRPGGSTPRLILAPSGFRPRYVDWGPAAQN